MASGELRILFVEDDAADVEIEEHELRSGGLQFRSQRTDTREGLIRALTDFNPDLVISDYALPAIDGLTALRIVRDIRPDIPFIFVSGTLGDERAVQSLKEGATDYVVKDRLARLVPVIKRAINESRERVERRKLEEQFRQSQKMEAIGRLAGGVAHDFNNLLTAIVGYSEILVERLDPGELLHEFATQILKAAERASNLTRQLLAFSRKQVLDLRSLDVNVIVADLGRMLRRIIGENIEMTTTLPPSLWRVKGDAGQVEQVLINLVVNARDAMPEGGRLSIATSNVTVETGDAARHGGARPGSYVVLAVRDDGVGMLEEVKAHIFEPFFTTKPAGQGTGLGLSTVYGIVRQSGGHVVVDSDPGRGATFKIYLPRVEEPENVEAKTKDVGSSTQGTETILLVEDEDVVRHLARNVLGEKGYNVLEASGGAQAIEICKDHHGPIDLLLTDLIMPGMSGRDLAVRVEALRRGTRVLFISGYSDNAGDVRSMLDERTHFLAKPFSPEGLRRKVRDVLDAPVA